MTLLEDDLLSALKEMLEASEAAIGGAKLPADEMSRYNRAVEWSRRVITLAESEAD